MASLFDTLELGAFRAGITARTEESKKWFQANIKKLGQVNRTSLLKDDALDPVTKTVFGNMYMYFYDPKYKDTLPYYDAFPLVIMMGPAKGGFYGLNLHYLPPVLRAKALDALLGEGELPMKFIKPTIHRYLTKHVKSRFALVDKPEWEIATFLPTQDFRKASSGTVYRDSRGKM